MAEEQDKSTLGLQYLIVEPRSLTRVTYSINGNLKERYGMDRDKMYPFIAKFITDTQALQVAQKCLMTFQPFAVDIEANSVVQLQFDFIKERQEIRRKTVFPTTKEVDRVLTNEKKTDTFLNMGWFKEKLPIIDKLIQKVMKGSDAPDEGKIQ